VSTLGCPPHLLLLDHALADDLVDGRLDERAGDGFARPIPLAVARAIGDGWASVLDRAPESAEKLLSDIARIRAAPHRSSRAAYVAVQTTERERLERERPAGPAGPDVLQVSADGAMVPLVGGEWAEVKTVAVGRVEVVTNRDGVAEARARDLSYFSRLTDAGTFTREAWVELHGAGIATAKTVCGVMDGADWEQTFLDVHRADAIRILDFPHAVEYLTKAAQATWCMGATAADTWVQEQAHILKHDEHGAAKVLKALVHLPVDQANYAAAARQARETALNYLTKRLDQIQYATFQAQGLPIGSGSVESANKLVVEVRLKGSGMHWARSHVNPLVALRTIACSDRWTEAWPQIERHLRDQARQRRTQRQRAHRTARTSSCANQAAAVPARSSPRSAPQPTPPRPLTAYRQRSADCRPSVGKAPAPSWRPSRPCRSAKTLTGTPRRASPRVVRGVAYTVAQGRPGSRLIQCSKVSS
jgi:hypothetical protein